MEIRLRKTGIFVKGKAFEKLTIGSDFVYVTSEPLKIPVFIPAGKAKKLRGRNKIINDMIRKLWKLKSKETK